MEQFAPQEGFDRNVMFLDLMRHFITVALGEVEPACTLHDGIRALEMASEARKHTLE
jgi:hypothetical protein